MAGSGSVAWIFSKRGYILIDKNQVSEDDIFTISVDAGAQDIKTEGENYEVFCEPQDFEVLKESLKSKGIKYELAELTMVPNSTIQVTGQAAKQLLTLVEFLENHADVKTVYANFDIPEAVLEKIAQELSS